MEEKYQNYISLGYFCEVAKDLEKMGLRSFSSPFDWGISHFSSIIEAIDNRFHGFFMYENLSQNTMCRSHYHEDQYNFYFFHDFDAYHPLVQQYNKVKEKYWRRINRFLSSIKEPTLFIRYISSEDKDLSNKSLELIWIEENYDYIMDVLKRYNSLNDIIFIGDESMESNKIKIFRVKHDENDIVSRSPIINNKELFPILDSYFFPKKEVNKQIYLSKEKRKKFTRFKTRALKVAKRLFCHEYHHTKTYSIPNK